MGINTATGQGWEQVYNQPATNSEVFMSCRETSDGGFIFYGNAGDSLWLVKTNAGGTAQWNHTDTVAVSRDIIQAHNGDYIAVGGVEDGGMIFRFDANGNPLWKFLRQDQLNLNGYPHVLDGTCEGVVELADSTMVVWGTRVRTSSGYDAYLTKHNANGGQIWAKHFWDWNEDRGREIHQTPDGGFILSGRDADANGPWLIKVDANGVEQWSSDLSIINSGIHQGVVPTSDGGYLLNFAHYSTGIPPLRLFKYDSQGNVLWNRNVGQSGDTFEGRVVAAHNYGFMVVFTSNRYGNGDRDIIVMQLNEIGEELWHLKLGGSGDDRGHSIRATSDGGYIVAGSSTSFNVSNEKQAYAIKLHPDDFPCEATVTHPQICGGDTYVVGSSVYTQSGTYMDTLTSANGCDSVVTTFLTVVNSPIDEYRTVCHDSYYVIGGDTLTESGTYTHQFTSTANCDSTIITHLTVQSPRDSVMVRKICEGESIFLGTTTWNHYYQTGTYVEHRTTALGCDSTITLHLTVYPNYHETISATICEGDTFSVGTYTHTDAGSYDDYFFAAGVCDSIITLNLTVLSSFDTTIYATICNGGSFTVGSDTYTETGVYEYDFPMANGCDSTVTLNLTVLGADTTVVVSICNGDSYSVGSNTYTTTGLYVDTFALSNGCDSIVRTDLTITDYGTDSLGNPLVQITGTVYEDSGGCTYNSGDTPLAGWVVEAESGGNAIYATTDNTGHYSFVVPYGTYNVSAQTPANWLPCGSSSQTVTLGSNTACSMQVDIGMEPDFDCALLDLDLSIICLVPCSTSTYHLNYHNIGTATAYDPVISFVAGPYITVDWSSEPWLTPQSGGIYDFHLDSVPAGASGWIAIAVTVDCNPNLIDFSVCSGAIHDASQCCLDYDAYGGAQIELAAQCVNNDSIEFQIKNTGAGNMVGDLDYFILQDDIIYAIDNFNLPSQGVEIVRVDATSHTYRLEAEQEPAHPYLPAPAISVEGCGGAVQSEVSVGYSDILENGDQIPSIDFTCTPITEDCSCNQMYGSPLGVGVAHYITAEEQLEYTIRFQNQGSVIGQDLVIIDTLPAELDPMSIIKGEASHNFNFDVYSGGIVKWEMKDINLVPGTPGTMENSGFVKFTVGLKPNLPVGTVVKNQAHIHFDAAQGIATNEVFHTIGERFVDFLIPIGIDDIKNPEHMVSIFPNPFSESTTLEIQGLEASQVYIEIYDMEGRLVQQDVANSKYIIQIHRKGMADGMYTYKVIADGEFIGTGKLIVGGTK